MCVSGGERRAKEKRKKEQGEGRKRKEDYLGKLQQETISNSCAMLCEDKTFKFLISFKSQKKYLKIRE